MSWTGRFKRAATLSPRDWRLLADAAATLLIVRIGLRLVSFNRLLRWATTVRHNRSVTADSARATALRTAWFVDVAADWHFLPMRCLARSLALARLLSRRSIPVNVKLGVRRSEQQLLAHAWVEWGGEPINDSRDPASHHGELSSLAFSSKHSTGESSNV